MQQYTIVDALRERLEKNGHAYGYIVGYDGVQDSDMPNGMGDFMTQSGNALPTMDYLQLITDLYKPLQIRGSERGLIWVDMYDSGGYKIDLPQVVNHQHILRLGKVW